MKEKCLKCSHPSKGCIPFLMTLTTPELREWCRMWKDRFGWSNGDVSKKSGVPKGTVDRVLGYNDKGVNLVTIRPIMSAIIGCTVEEMEACEKDNVSVIALEEENRKLKEQLQRTKKTFAEIKEEKQKNEEFLKQQLKHEHQTARGRKNLCIILGILLALALAVIITALVADRLNSDIGFFWIDRLAATFGNDGISVNGLNNIIEWRL